MGGDIGGSEHQNTAKNLANSAILPRKSQNTIFDNTSLPLITNVMPKPSLCTLHLEQMTDITNKLEFVNGNSIIYFFKFQSVFERIGEWKRLGKHWRT